MSDQRDIAFRPQLVETGRPHLYLLASRLGRGRDVVEVGCGDGKGAAWLAETAASVVAVGEDDAAFAATRSLTPGGDVRFEVAHLSALPLGDATADLVLAFQPLPDAADAFMAELRRVLRPEGLLLLAATHDRAQLRALVLRHFPHATLATRRSGPASAIMELDRDARAAEMIGAIDGPETVVLAGAGKLPRLGDSVMLLEGVEPPVAAPSPNAGQLQVRQLRTQVMNSYAESRLAVRSVFEIRHELGRVADQLLQKTNGEREAIAVVEALRAEIRLMRASRLWRVMDPVRRVGGALRGMPHGPEKGVEPVPMPMHEAPRIETAPDPVDAPGVRPLRLVLSDAPVVSIVIATYGQPAMTLGCLRSLEAAPPSVPLEIILVDDAAPSTPELDAVLSLAEAAGVRLVRNPVNRGFLRSCNEAAAAARGAFIYLLNNDTELRPGAVDALHDLLEARPDAGMAGSKLIYPDGTLQEAGGIVWNDATAWNYGRGQDPARPEFNYVREVDYCSGASIMIRRALWDRLGGFDDAFAPAYYEDADLAFRIRAAGLKVLYEPRSVVVHFEGMSHGTDVGQGGKAHQLVNEKLMRERWRGVLREDHYPNGTNVLRARDRARHRKVALVIDHYALEPDRDAGSRSTLGIVLSLLEAGWVVKFWPQNQAYNAVYTPQLEAMGVEMIDQRRAEPLEAWLRQEGRALDHALVVRPEVAADTTGALMRFTDAVLSFYGVDLHFARMRRQATLENDGALALEADRMERLERRLWKMFDVVIYPSHEEAVVVREMAPGIDAFGIVPFTFDIQPPRAAPPAAPLRPDERVLLFVAGFAHPPNVDAALFLAREILPVLEAEIGPIHVILAGSNPTEAVRALAGPRVTVTGFITDEELASLYGRARASVVPLRFGAGVKGKVIEALSHGLPVVTTSIGAQGIEGLRGVVPVHDDPAAIAASLAALMRDDAKWIAQSRAQTAFAEVNFSRAAMRRSVLTALRSADPTV